MEIGSAFPLDKPLSMEIKGRNLIEGIPQTITIDDSEIASAGECIAVIMNAIRVALERTPPELSPTSATAASYSPRRRAAQRTWTSDIREEDRPAGFRGRPNPLASVVLEPARCSPTSAAAQIRSIDHLRWDLRFEIYGLQVPQLRPGATANMNEG